VNGRALLYPCIRRKILDNNPGFSHRHAADVHDDDHDDAEVNRPTPLFTIPPFVLIVQVKSVPCLWLICFMDSTGA
jgi:hypothetical protein